MSRAAVVRLHSHEPELSPGLAAFLAAHDASVALAVGGRLWLVTEGTDGGPAALELGLADVSALAWHDGRLSVASAWQVWSFVDALDADESEGDGEHLLLGQTAHTTGFLAVTDLAITPAGPLLVSALFSCLAVLDDRLAMRPVWSPAGLGSLAAETACLLTGVVLRDGEIAFVTSANRSAEPGAWRESPAGRGTVMTSAGDEVVGGLTVPRQPRWHDGALVVAESGTGRLLRIDSASGTVATVATLPGVLGALAVHGDHALVGRNHPTRAAIAGLEGGPASGGRTVRDGVSLVDLRSGSLVGELDFLGHAGRVEAIAVLPGLRRVTIAPPRGPVAQSTVVVAPPEPLGGGRRAVQVRGARHQYDRRADD